MERKLIALHKHWCTADSVSYHLGRSAKGGTHASGLDPALETLGAAHSAFLALSVWYALLYVVIEGYRECGMSDRRIDELLLDEAYVDALRRFRNATFHFQADPISEKLMEILEHPKSEEWIGSLSQAFRSFFEHALDLSSILERLAGGPEGGE